MLLSGAKDVDHDIDAIQVMAASLLVADTRPTVQEQEEAMSTSVMPQLRGVIKLAVPGLHVMRSVQHKEGDEERPMPWPSFVCYCQGMISMRPHQNPQGIPLKLVLEVMQKVLDCFLSSSALLVFLTDKHTKSKRAVHGNMQQQRVCEWKNNPPSNQGTKEWPINCLLLNYGKLDLGPSSSFSIQAAAHEFQEYRCAANLFYPGV